MQIFDIVVTLIDMLTVTDIFYETQNLRSCKQ